MRYRSQQRWLATVFLCAGLLAFSSIVAAALSFPALTGRVVDQAGLLDAATTKTLNQVLAQEEQQTSNQVVVVTLKNLQGHTIADYGYQLGRHWGIGQQGRDNGVLLIVAAKERKVRIEVGYGLEGRLTDAVSSVIIHEYILPQFKRGDYSKGILIGVQKIMGVLKGSFKPESHKNHKGTLTALLYFILLVIIVMFGMFGGGGPRGPGRRRGRYYNSYYGGWYGGGFGGGGGSSGGGFSGGGGSFGGGGASGGW